MPFSIIGTIVHPNSIDKPTNANRATTIKISGIITVNIIFAIPFRHQVIKERIDFIKDGIDLMKDGIDLMVLLIEERNSTKAEYKLDNIVGRYSTIV